jgi:hypothetical protein
VVVEGGGRRLERGDSDGGDGGSAGRRIAGGHQPLTGVGTRAQPSRGGSRVDGAPLGRVTMGATAGTEINNGRGGSDLTMGGRTGMTVRPRHRASHRVMSE